MTDAADTAPDTAADDAAADDTVAGRLLALQYIDTQSDQLRVKRERLPEREELSTRSDQMAAWERRRNQITSRLDELTAVIEQAEERSTELGADRSRLEAQMKTVIAPREAEALMHEIATINGQRDELDDVELAALEEQSTLDDERTIHLGSEGSLRAAVGSADEMLARACADIDTEMEQLAAGRTGAVDALDESIVSRYESVRAAAGVAVAELKRHRCEGCHLDLSAAEVDTAKEEAAVSGYTECPQCGRLLVV
jgi:predicted  nucleic acid-binding Zn-ribbon protein